MKAHVTLCSLVLLLVVCRLSAEELSTNDWGPVTNNAQMSISVVASGSVWHSRRFIVPGGTNRMGGLTVVPITAKAQLKAGESFSLLVRVRNLSTNETLHFADEHVVPDVVDGLACAVISPSGKDVYPKMPAHAPNEPILSSGHGFAATARPGETAEFEFRLSDLCRLDEIGTYKITAKKSPSRKAFVLTSNTLSLSVVSDK